MTQTPRQSMTRKARQAAARYAVAPDVATFGAIGGSTVAEAIAVEAGLPLSALDELEESGITRQEIHALVIPPRTLAHRRSKGETLSTEEGERVVRLGHVLRAANRVFGDREKALVYLREPKARFHGRPPLLMARTESGGRAVEELLIQIEEGYFA